MLAAFSHLAAILAIQISVFHELAEPAVASVVRVCVCVCSSTGITEKYSSSNYTVNLVK